MYSAQEHIIDSIVTGGCDVFGRQVIDGGEAEAAGRGRRHKICIESRLVGTQLGRLPWNGRALTVGSGA